MQHIDFVWILIQTIKETEYRQMRPKKLLLILLNAIMAVWYERDCPL